MNEKRRLISAAMPIVIGGLGSRSGGFSRIRAHCNNPDCPVCGSGITDAITEAILGPLLANDAGSVDLSSVIGDMPIESIPRIEKNDGDTETMMIFPHAAERSVRKLIAAREQLRLAEEVNETLTVLISILDDHVMPEIAGMNAYAKETLMGAATDLKEKAEARLSRTRQSKAIYDAGGSTEKKRYQLICGELNLVIKKEGDELLRYVIEHLVVKGEEFLLKEMEESRKSMIQALDAVRKVINRRYGDAEQVASIVDDAEEEVANLERAIRTALEYQTDLPDEPEELLALVRPTRKPLREVVAWATAPADATTAEDEQG